MSEGCAGGHGVGLSDRQAETEGPVIGRFARRIVTLPVAVASWRRAAIGPHPVRYLGTRVPLDVREVRISLVLFWRCPR